MARATVTISGGDALLKKFQQMGLDVGTLLPAAALAGAAVVVADANPRAPEPIVAAEIVKQTTKRVEVDIGIPDDRWYLKFFETGTQPHEIPGPLTIPFEGEMQLVGGASHPGMGAKPFLRPALDGNTAQARDAVGAKLKAALK